MSSSGDPSGQAVALEGKKIPLEEQVEKILSLVPDYPWEDFKPYWRKVARCILLELARGEWTKAAFRSDYYWRRKTGLYEAKKFVDKMLTYDDFILAIKEFNLQASKKLKKKVDWLEPANYEQLGILIYKVWYHLRSHGVLYETPEGWVKIAKHFSIPPEGKLREVFEFMVLYYRRHSRFPSVDTLKRYTRFNNTWITKGRGNWDSKREMEAWALFWASRIKVEGKLEDWIAKKREEEESEEDQQCRVPGHCGYLEKWFGEEH